MRADLEFVAGILAQAVTKSSDQARLQKGVVIRSQIIQALSAGQAVEHYRMRWATQAVERTIEYIKGLCKEFDNGHPDDMASAQDICDILRGALALVSAEGTEAPKPDKQE